VAHIRDENGAVSDRLERHLVHRFGIGKLAVGVDVEIVAANADVASGQDEVRTVHGLHDVVER
jgi:hypothetical protein